MGLRSFLRVVGSGAAALLVSLAGSAQLMAADVPAPPSLVGAPKSFTAFDGPTIPAAPPVQIAPPFHGAVIPFATPATSCASCNNTGFFSKHRPCNGRAMSINPGTCFGFYHTQWSRWEDVCPIPVPGSVIAEPIPTVVVPAKPAAEPKADPKPMGSDAPLPRPSPMPMPSIPKP